MTPEQTKALVPDGHTPAECECATCLLYMEAEANRALVAESALELSRAKDIIRMPILNELIRVEMVVPMDPEDQMCRLVITAPGQDEAAIARAVIEQMAPLLGLQTRED